MYRADYDVGGGESGAMNRVQRRGNFKVGNHSRVFSLTANGIVLRRKREACRGAESLLLLLLLRGAWAGGLSARVSQKINRSQ